MIALLSLFAAADAQEIRALHLSPDAPAVDIFVNDGTPAAIPNLAFTEGTPYVALPAGLTNIKVSPAGATPRDAVLDVDIPLVAGVKVSAVAYGSLDQIGALALVDDDANIAPGNIRLQVAHAAVGIGPVNVFVGGVGVASTDLGFGDSFVADIPGRARRVGLDTNNDFTADWTFDVPDLGADALVNVFAATDADGQPFLLAWLPDGTTARVDGVPVAPARVRVAHLSPDAPPVDVYVDGALAIPNLPFESLTGFLSVPAGPRQVQVFAAGTTANPVIDTVLSVRAGRSYTVAAYGNVANIAAAVHPEGPCDFAGKTCLSVVHAADGVGTVDVLADGLTSPLLAGVDYGRGGRVRLDNGPYTVGLDLDADGTAEFTFDVPDVGERTRVLVAAVLDANGPFLYAMLPDSSAVRIDPN